MTERPRRLSIVAMCLLLLATLGCGEGPKTTQHALSSGRTIRMISVGPMVGKFGQALVLSYQTDQPMTDVDALRKEVAEIWADFRTDAGKASVDTAVITANERPAGMLITHARSFNFVFERKPEGGWSEFGAKVEGADIGRFGLFTTDETVVQIASGTASGRVRAARRMPTWMSAAETIARAKGAVFGYEFTVRGQPKGSSADVKVVVEHPPFQAPGSVTPSAVESWLQPIIFETPSFAGYGLDEDWEMVPGMWTVRVYRGSRLLCEKAFTIE
jgi:hypothetical protein